ncbi:hypothetical protein BKA65DRAFT_507375 [Rhexocercosporidium sp. MPI-PUGE-AT-0058]|nr:hypothetical protein BKA65DRAFT_507375 [Rhexocercosporidium sp. MPI-PUGE-AT-0058]
MAETLGAALAVVAFADQCLKYGNKFVKRCKSYLHAEEEAVELLVSIEVNWLKMETQIGILKRVAAAGQLSKALQTMQSQVLSQLEGKLKTASLIIEQLMAEKREEQKARAKKDPKNANWNHDDRDITAVIKDFGGMRANSKLKYVHKKKALLEIIQDIERWQARYDPTWILIMQMSSKNIDEELEQQEKNPKREQIPIISAAKGIRDAVRASQEMNVPDRGTVWISNDEIDLNPTRIPHSSVEFSLLNHEKSMVLIDTMISNTAANANSTTKEVRNLARILAEVDPSTFGLLKCQGVIRVPKSNSFNALSDFKFIFEVPAQLSSPQSLRAVLLSGKLYPLDERLELAKKLASSVLFVHTMQFVHKNIRPETIVVFENEHSTIGAPYLAGFQKFRIEDGNTFLVGDSLWDHNLYRHPGRQGTLPEMQYQMQHDIYSLGVVLLEIGLWTSFASPDLETSSMHPNPVLGPANLDSAIPPQGTPTKLKGHLEALAKNELPSRLGKRFTEIVLQCLQCLDKNIQIEGESSDEKEGRDSGFGVGVGGDDEEIVDEDGVVIGVRYIENVLQKLLEITV